MTLTACVRAPAPSPPLRPEPSAPPAQFDDICAILQERPSWWRAVNRAQARWGAPAAFQLAFIRRESAFDGGAVNGDTRAAPTGYAQAVLRTWTNYQRETGAKDAKRTSFADSADFIAWHAHKVRDTFGVPFKDVRQHYFAYNLGFGGFKQKAWQGNAQVQSLAEQTARDTKRYEAQLKRCGAKLDDASQRPRR